MLQNRPTLLLNEGIAKRNIQRMMEKAEKNQLSLRPHFKTHVSLQIGEWFRDAGVHHCTVSSVEMAAYFARGNKEIAGWKDITIAFPFNRLEIDLVNQLAQTTNLNLVLEDTDTLSFLDKQLTASVNYFIKLDVGTHRTGLSVDSDFTPLIRDTDRLHFKGFLAHAGHAYRSRSHQEITSVYAAVKSQLGSLKERYPTATISYGDTPTCSIVEDFHHMDELRPGNFVFYDWMQCEITSCQPEDVAVCLSVPVVAKHPDRQEVVIHGGAVHFSKDSVVNAAGDPVFGAMVTLEENGWKAPEKIHYLKKVSQEHGIIHVTDRKDFDNIQIGDRVGVLPAHSCLAADLMARYVTTEGQELFHMNWRR